ncbi:hypothetical protein LB542_19705 [Mesorhizobium sp. BR1-1-9]|uniref:hypothetical protein n=1 Tax=Mesorhizobium sp. BR1-1-9 TaxID=2876646 RepID=UPI001CD18E99|nr:hypothetical protein [Mesorhizobium sp. BR1-1-9]MBZ9873076.1 hypothetical protein [Mesorhizobium sp. BR1-1-9]
MLTIHPADPYSVAVALNVVIDWPAVAYVGIDDDDFVGSGGLAWGGDKCWLWFQVSKPKPEYARPVLKMAQRMLRKAVQLGETEVYTVRDQTYPSSTKLLKLVGFELSEIKDGQEVHAWHFSQ